MLRQTWHKQYCLVLFSVLFCGLILNIVVATPTSLNSNGTEGNNYNCPEDCQCLIPAVHHDHGSVHHFLHAKCQSLKGLQSENPINSTLPIHSIDLSYLGLTRLAHSLDQLNSLTSIDLSHNELHEIGHLSRRIKKLNLKHNRITSSKLTKLPSNLQSLNLQHNDISNLPLELTQLSQLKYLELSHNPINCSCETLNVRNWLKERNVFMENAVKCSLPLDVKGLSWLQLNHVDICEKEKNHNIDWNTLDNDNELMLGDQPAIEHSGDRNEDDEIDKDFIPVENKSQANDVHKSSHFEGSGDLNEPSMRLEATTTQHSQEDEMSTTAFDIYDDHGASGSGDSPIKEPDFDRHSPNLDPPVTHISLNDHNDKMHDNKPLEQPSPSDLDKNNLGIYHPNEEAVIVPEVHHHDVGSESSTTEGPKAAIMQAKTLDNNDSNATYFLLGVIVLIVVGLILFVGIKRCKNQRNARHDAENPRQTELLDMDKKNLGKPLYKENAPLIGDQTKADLAKPINGAGKKPYDANDVKDGGNQDQPLLKNGSGNGTAPKDANEPNVQPEEATAPLQQAPHEYYPITPRYPTPKSPRASKYAQYPPSENNNNSPNANDAYLPSSPKLGRYSPVYSPETGRVKIKLTETPKPKTPMLVTRSKSNAGDIITTPVHAGVANGSPVVAVHTGTNGHATGHY